MMKDSDEPSLHVFLSHSGPADVDGFLKWIDVSRSKFATRSGLNQATIKRYADRVTFSESTDRRIRETMKALDAERMLVTTRPIGTGPIGKKERMIPRMNYQAKGNEKDESDEVSLGADRPADKGAAAPTNADLVIMRDGYRRFTVAMIHGDTLLGARILTEEDIDRYIDMFMDARRMIRHPVDKLVADK